MQRPKENSRTHHRLGWLGWEPAPVDNEWQAVGSVFHRLNSKDDDSSSPQATPRRITWTVKGSLSPLPSSGHQLIHNGGNIWADSCLCRIFWDNCSGMWVLEFLLHHREMLTLSSTLLDEFTNMNAIIGQFVLQWIMVVKRKVNWVKLARSSLVITQPEQSPPCCCCWRQKSWRTAAWRPHPGSRSKACSAPRRRGVDRGHAWRQQVISSSGYLKTRVSTWSRFFNHFLYWQKSTF